MIRVEIGANRVRPGWVDIDHKTGTCKDIMLDPLPFEDNTVDVFYMSHVIEHIPIRKVPELFKQFHSKLVPGGTLRIVCPDLRRLAQAYVSGDLPFFENFVARTDALHNSLGIGGRFVNNIVSYGSDTQLYSRSGEVKLAGIAHIAGYDAEMMTTLLKGAGFPRVLISTYNAQIDPHPHDGQLFVEAYKEI